VKTDQILGLILFIFSVVMWFILIPSQVVGNKGQYFPKFITFWIGFSGILLVCLKKKKTNDTYMPEEKNNTKLRYKYDLYITFGLIIIYYLITEHLGFFVTSYLLVFMLMINFGIRNWKLLISMPLSLLVITYLFLVKVLELSLPNGILF